MGQNANPEAAGASSSTSAPVESERAVPAPAEQCGGFLLAAVEAMNLDFFRVVRAKYTLVARRDATFDKYLDEIEARAFGERRQRGGLGAIFDALLGGGGGPGGA